MKKYTNLATVILCGALLLVLTLWAWFKAPVSFSESERRSLAQAPECTYEGLASGLYMNDFETYSQDQFPLRDSFRTLKALCVKYLFGQKDNNGLYSVDGYVSKLEYPLNEARLEQAIAKINAIEEKYLAGTDCTVYLSLIPDKNCFLAPMGGYPHIDFDTVEERLLNKVAYDSYIDIEDLLSIEDFYLTDQHWRQECILDVAEHIGSAMNGAGGNAPAYTEITVDTPFYGAYVGQSALPAEEDHIHYLTNAMLEGCAVMDYSSGKAKESTVYTLDKASGRDPYELFLNGSTPLTVIANPNAETDRELVVFRDSFGSSLVPLLVHRYAKVTVIDLRYINSAYLGSFVSFDDQDVLFIYSTLILNNVISQ